jgi:Zn-dependent peptidase ImmA (M78 family)
VRRLAPYFHEKQIAREANLLLRSFDRKNPGAAGSPPYDLEAILWDVLNETDGLSLDTDLDLGRCPVTNDLILGKTVLEKKVIFLTKSLKGKPYYPFTFAHELGHWILHCRPLLETGQANFLEVSEAPTGEFTTFQRAISDQPNCKDPFEIQANMFAGCLLMPEELVRDRFARHFPPHSSFMPPEGDLREFARELAKSHASGEKSLAEEFGVSVDCMGVRLIKLELAQKDPSFV